MAFVVNLESDGIWTKDLWYKKWPKNQLFHNNNLSSNCKETKFESEAVNMEHLPMHNT